MNLGTAQIIRADSRNLPLPDNSVDLIVTSPPYFALRSYQDGGQHYAGQIGDEPTPDEFVSSLLEMTRECRRVLKPSGSLWVNLGDKYAGSNGRAGGGGKSTLAGAANGRARDQQQTPLRGGFVAGGAPTKSLIGIPWRYALRCIDDLGLILRAEVIWSKCLSGGARVYARTPTGDRPVMLRDLVRAYKPENVQLWNGQKWTQVLLWERTPDDDGALEFELRTGERIGCTTNHRWPTQRGLLFADEIRKGDVIETTRLPESDDLRMPALLPDDDIGWLIGLYIAEGSRSGTTIQFAGHIKEDARFDRLSRIAAALDGVCRRHRTSENGETINITGNVVSGVVDRYVSVGTAHTKRLRSVAWRRSNAFLAAVVAGYLSGDGHFDRKNDRWRLGFTANDEWAADLRTLAARLGAVCRLRRATHKLGDREFPGWRGEWRWTRSEHHNAKPDGEVVAIRRSRARDFYDLTVADCPHLFALASGVLTHNSNGLPESVTDRVRRAHEQWFHFVQQPRYFSAVDEVREAHRSEPGREGRGALGGQKAMRPVGPNSGAYSTLGALPGSVRTVPTEPLRVPDHLGVDHFAAFPTAWPKWIIQGWAPTRGVCVACGEGRRPTSRVERQGDCRVRRSSDRGFGIAQGDNRNAGVFSITGYACACPDTTAPTTPAVILDPFGGTGTTALVAKALGCHGISVDMSADYCRLAEWRTNDPGQLAKVLEVEKPPEVDPSQDALFDVETNGGGASRVRVATGR